MNDYKSPYFITEYMLNLAAFISGKLGRNEYIP